LALMALLGAGYTDRSGPYQTQVRSAIDYLLSRIQRTDFGGNLAEGSMYAQGIATIALSESFTMTRDARLEEPTKSAMKYIVTAQHPAGGWRYSPGEPGDMTVTGWQLMALKSCEMAGVDVPNKTWTSARKFIDALGDSSSGWYGYQEPEQRITTTSIALLMKMYLGLDQNDAGLQSGIAHLIAAGPSETDIYFDFYATQVLHHAGARQWSQWNQQMRDFLIERQSTDGHAAGSWHFDDPHGNVGGRLYSTAMAVMILEVYYRFMPLYGKL
jgi:hypothetical protein